MEAQAPQRKSADERKAALATAVANLIAQGMRVESQSDYQAVLVRGRRVNHVLHAILTIFTFGMWAFVWLALTVFGGERRTIVAVDEWGNMTVTEIGKRGFS